MSSLFDMNSPEKLCPICMEPHAATRQCKYETLVKNVHETKRNIVALLRANKEAVETAKVFQKIIRDMMPVTEKLVAIEKEYVALINGLKGSKIHNIPGVGVGVTVDDINSLLPPDTDDKDEFMAWLKKRHVLTEEKVGTEELQAKA